MSPIHAIAAYMPPQPFARFTRPQIETIIERAIEYLDALDGDADLEEGDDLEAIDEREAEPPEIDHLGDWGVDQSDLLPVIFRQ